MTYLREQNYDLSDVALTGASAGALVATLTATEVDFEEATTNALQKAENAGVWDRTFGLQGIWGPMIESWLDELIPEEPLEMVNGRVSFLSSLELVESILCLFTNFLFFFLKNSAILVNYTNS